MACWFGLQNWHLCWKTNSAWELVDWKGKHGMTALLVIVVVLPVSLIPRMGTKGPRGGHYQNKGWREHSLSSGNALWHKSLTMCKRLLCFSRKLMIPVGAVWTRSSPLWEGTIALYKVPCHNNCGRVLWVYSRGTVWVLQWSNGPLYYASLGWQFGWRCVFSLHNFHALLSSNFSPQHIVPRVFLFLIPN